jgi:WD40 repeat protein
MKKNEEGSKNYNEEILTNFEYTSNHNFINKNSFLTNFPNSIKNILAIRRDNQGAFWNNHINRSNHFISYLNNFEAYRCEPIEEIEKNLKKIYKKSKKFDDIYQYKYYLQVGKTHICHFQVRKNILQNKQYLIYNKKYSIEVYDTIKNKKQSLITIEESQTDGIICFDVYHDNEKFLICLGNNNGNCDIFSVKENDFIDCLDSKNSSKVPKFKKDLNLLASEKLENNDSINDVDDPDAEAELFINYVKFISDNKLLTTSNDCHFKINDLNKQKSDIKYKNEFPINHCDIDNDRKILICIGDSKSINIVDLKSNKKIKTLDEHFDYGMIVKINPYNNNYFASGNQDLACKIWDIRNLDNGSLLTSYGINDCIGDLDWINSKSLCYMENSLFSHIFDIENNTIQDLAYDGFGNGVVHDKLNDNIYINIYKGNDDYTGGILCYENLKNKVYNSFNNINL